MVHTWQLWLSPRPARRTETPSEPRMLSQNGAALFEFQYERDGRLVVRETHYAENKLVQNGRSGPPLYVARPSSLNMPPIADGGEDIFTVARQSTFKLRAEPWLSSGMERKVFSPKVVASSRSHPEPGTIFPPPSMQLGRADTTRCSHRFWAEGPVKEDLVFRVWAEPQNLDRGFDEAFLRNYLGYLRDCADQNIQPSVFQLALLGWSGDTLLTPPWWVPLWMLRLLHFIVAHLVGRLFLG
ncbi:hypothetical protein J7337_012911 [Fusarium musae]|uniref:Uncharacterized protein n=1 Tax=Fusarium musae TaxID=1042133 RepID=A0A9P8IK03_9HYPO|nr:hypothetical protein J7337_012911 [Fusarium musae]KAG9496325.1 hypothetical protein J7337_012911 [Fusarium musae]